MPLLDYICPAGHRVERMVPLAQFDYAQRCGVDGCRKMLRQILPYPPGVNTGAEDRAAYFEHNITASGQNEDGSIKHTPNAHSEQCQCESCCRHRRKHSVTEAADVKKFVYL